MKKNTLKKILTKIKKEYVPTNEKRDDLFNDAMLNLYVDALGLNPPSLAQYLFDTGLCNDPDDIKEAMIRHGDAPAIISSFIDHLDILTYDFDFYTIKPN